MPVLIPWRGGDADRERALEWVLNRHQGADVAVFNGHPWCKARAVMPALRRMPDDIVVVADADVWCEGIESAIRAVTCGVANWAIPHKTVHRLSREGTDALLAGAEWSGKLDRRPYKGIFGGGIVVAHRDTFLEVPLDARFTGWGQEDESWGIALSTLAGLPWRGEADLIHLWHPPMPRMGGRRGNPEGWELYKRYATARGKPDEMRDLIFEGGADVAVDPDVAALHDHPAHV